MKIFIFRVIYLWFLIRLIQAETHSRLFQKPYRAQCRILHPPLLLSSDMLPSLSPLPPSSSTSVVIVVVAVAFSPPSGSQHLPHLSSLLALASLPHTVIGIIPAPFPSTRWASFLLPSPTIQCLTHVIIFYLYIFLSCLLHFSPS